jgi:hypothetical protein
MIVIAVPRPAYPPDPDALAVAAVTLKGLAALPAAVDRLADADTRGFTPGDRAADTEG